MPKTFNELQWHPTASEVLQQQEIEEILKVKPARRADCQTIAEADVLEKEMRIEALIRHLKEEKDPAATKDVNAAGEGICGQGG